VVLGPAYSHVIAVGKKINFFTWDEEIGDAMTTRSSICSVCFSY
jgi:fructose-1,6-bisphosphatase